MLYRYIRVMFQNSVKNKTKNCDSWHVPVICMVAINDETQINFEFDNDAIYHFTVMPLQNVKNSSISWW